MFVMNINKLLNMMIILIIFNIKVLSVLCLFFIEFFVNVLVWDKDIEMCFFFVFFYFVRFNKVLFNLFVNSFCVYFFDFCIFVDVVNFIVFIGYLFFFYFLVIFCIVILGVFFNLFCVIFFFCLI